MIFHYEPTIFGDPTFMEPPICIHMCHGHKTVLDVYGLWMFMVILSHDMELELWTPNIIGR